MGCYLEILVLLCGYSSYRNVMICQSPTASNCSASQHTILINSGKKAKNVGCKIRSMRSLLVFLIRGIHFSAMTSLKPYVDVEQISRVGRVFWIGSRLREMVALGGSTALRNLLFWLTFRLIIGLTICIQIRPLIWLLLIWFCRNL